MLSRSSHFNLTTALAVSTMIPILQMNTEILSNLPKIAKLVNSGPRFVTHTDSKRMLLSLSRGLPGEDEESRY